MLTFILKYIPQRTLIIASSALLVLLLTGFSVNHLHNKSLAQKEAAHQAALVAQTQESLNKVNVLQGKIDELGSVVLEKEKKLAESNAKLKAAIGKPLPPMPPTPPGVDPCEPVRVAATQREAVLVEALDLAVVTKNDAEAVIPPLKAQFNFAIQQKDQALVAVKNEKELVTSLSLKLDATEKSLHTWKVGGITLGVTGLAYLLLKR